MRLQVDTIKDMSQQVQQQLDSFWMEGRLQQLAITLMQRFFPLTVGPCSTMVFACFMAMLSCMQRQFLGRYCNPLNPCCSPCDCLQTMLCLTTRVACLVCFAHFSHLPPFFAHHLATAFGAENLRCMHCVSAAADRSTELYLTSLPPEGSRPPGSTESYFRSATLKQPHLLSCR